MWYEVPLDKAIMYKTVQFILDKNKISISVLSTFIYPVIIVLDKTWFKKKVAVRSYISRTFPRLQHACASETQKPIMTICLSISHLTIQGL